MKALVIRWERTRLRVIGGTRPSTGEELVCDGLRGALQAGKVEFSEAELSALAIPEGELTQRAAATQRVRKEAGTGVTNVVADEQLVHGCATNERGRDGAARGWGC